MKLFEGNKLSLTLLFFIIVTVSSCKKEISESDFQYDEHELLKERDETSEFLIKNFRKGVDSSQIIWQSKSEDLNGDGINEKIKIVIANDTIFTGHFSWLTNFVIFHFLSPRLKLSNSNAMCTGLEHSANAGINSVVQGSGYISTSLLS